MKRLLPTAVFLTAAALAMPALAIDVQIGGRGDDDDIDVMIGTPEDIPANADENPFANTNARLNPNGVPVTTIQLRAAEGACAIPAAFVGPPCPPTAFVLVNGQEIAGTLVFTNDGAQVGTVYGAGTTVDAETVILVDVNQEWMNTLQKVAVRIPSIYTADAGYVIATTDADLRASLTAALEAAAAGLGAPLPIPGVTTRPADTPAPAGLPPTPPPAPTPAPTPVPGAVPPAG